MVYLSSLALVEQMTWPLSSTDRACTKLFNLVHSNYPDNLSAKPLCNRNVLIIIPSSLPTALSKYFLKIDQR